MKTILSKKLSMLFIGCSLVLVGCGGGGGGGSNRNNSASQCAGNSDSFICEVFKVVNNLTSETADAREIDSITVTSPEDADPTEKI